MAIITLLTDFGLRDEYVGVLKGVILRFNPGATIIDLSHSIDPQDVVQAAFMLQAAYSYFPKGTIHMAVVDPGVGSQRSIIAARYNGYCFLSPDNGLLNGVWGGNQPEVLVAVENTSLFLHPVSHTFHGRDIFAPTAARLSMGMEMSRLGPSLEPGQLVGLGQLGADQSDPLRIEGVVLAIDHFGNLITNISAHQLSRLTATGGVEHIVVRVGHTSVVGLTTTYSQKDKGQAVALIGSRDLLEIAVNGSSAAQCLKVSKGDAIEVVTGRKGDKQ